MVILFVLVADAVAVAVVEGNYQLIAMKYNYLMLN
jgi:hypothetical protein